LIRDMADRHESLHVLKFIAIAFKAIRIQSWSPGALAVSPRSCRLACSHCVSVADVIVSVFMINGTSTLDTQQLVSYSPSLDGDFDQF
jgi:hypothetical protein